MLDKTTLSYIQGHTKGYVAHWVYTEHSRSVMVIARYGQNGNKTFRQFVPQNEGWIESVTSTPYLLFGLHTLGNLCPLDSIAICEGEKCAHLIHQLGWPCVTTAMGAKNISSTDFTPLRHFNQFVVLRDNDKPGINYVREVSTAIRRHRPDALIYVCNLAPDIPECDVIDWVMKYPLCGYLWDGFTALDDHHKQRVSEALRTAIDESAILVEDCPQVQFKAELSLFDGDSQPPQLKM